CWGTSDRRRFPRFRGGLRRAVTADLGLAGLCFAYPLRFPSRFAISSCKELNKAEAAERSPARPSSWRSWASLRAGSAPDKVTEPFRAWAREARSSALLRWSAVAMAARRLGVSRRNVRIIRLSNWGSPPMRARTWLKANWAGADGFGEEAGEGVTAGGAA